MKKFTAGLLILVLLSIDVCFAQSYNGYDGGVSSGGLLRQAAADTKSSSKQRKNSYQYSEVVFITGVPIVFSGTLDIVANTNSKETETYNYTYNLSNGGDKLTRTVQLEAKVSVVDRQTVRVINLKNKSPRETIKIGNESYTLSGTASYDFSMSTITDSQPAIDYHSGNWNSRKIYTSKSGKRITLSEVGKIVGYDQFWGRAEMQEIRFVVESEGEVLVPRVEPTPVASDDDEDYYDDEEETPKPSKTPAKTKQEYDSYFDAWGGSGDLVISSITSKKLSYDQNQPSEISFVGGYLQKQENNSVLSYTANLPIFDAKGISADTMEEYFNTISIESFPSQERLFFPDGTNIKGYWYERDVMEMYSLAVLPQTEKVDYRNFEQLLSRGEFARLVVNAVNMPQFVMPPPPKKQKTTRGVTPTPPPPVSPFTDVPDDHEFVIPILTLNDAGVMSGTSADTFNPQMPITRAEALTVFVRALGLESLAGSPIALTDFADNNDIPRWARSAINVANHIGLVKGDDRNNLNPNEWMKKSEAVAFVNRLVNYMREQIVVDYRDRLMNF